MFRLILAKCNDRLLRDVMRASPTIARVLAVFILSVTLANAAGKQPSQELKRALAAADRARSLPKGEAYVKATQATIRSVMYDCLRDCLGHVPGWRLPPGFQSVLIIGRTGKLKWIIRDARDPMTSCFLSKIVTLTFPPPPADNWPIKFNVGKTP